jgi:hypothetical protein
MTTAFAATERGESRAYEMDMETGGLLCHADEEPAPPPPSLLKNALVRLLLQDPVGTVMVIAAERLPATGRAHCVYYQYAPYDGAAYMYAPDKGWFEAPSTFPNSAIENALAVYKTPHQAALSLLAQWESSLDIDAYYTSANSGAENITWPSLTERAAWFAARRRRIANLEGAAGGATASRWAYAPPPCVGGEW